MASHTDDRYSGSDDGEKLPIESGVDLEKAHDHEHFAIEPEFDDPNFDKNAVVLEDDSPYPEVRSAVANTDDPSMPASSLRVWVIGLIWAMIIPGMNQFFFFRYPSVEVTGVRLLPLLSLLRTSRVVIYADGRS